MSNVALPHNCTDHCHELRNMQDTVVLDCGDSLSKVCALQTIVSRFTDTGEIQPPQCVICKQSVKAWASNIALNGIIEELIKNKDSTEVGKCAICTDDFKGRVSILNCGHSFDYDCITEWQNHSKKQNAKEVCPLCKKDIKWKTFNRAVEEQVKKFAPQIINPVGAAADIPDFVFGKAAWQECFGVDVGEEPPLPQEALDLAREKGYDLLLMPVTANGQPLDINLMREIVKSDHLGERQTNYRYLSDKVKEKLSGKTLGAQSYWVVVKKGLIEDSRGKNYDELKVLAESEGPGFRMPWTLEAIIISFASHVRSKEQPLGEGTYTRCLDDRWFVVGGLLSGRGLSVNCYGSDFGGVVGLRKF